MVKATNYNITIKKGQSWRLGLKVQDYDSSIKALTGYTAKLVVKDNQMSPALLTMTSANEEIIITENTGWVVLWLTAARTDALTFKTAKYDVLLTSPLGVNTYLIKGYFYVDDSVPGTNPALPDPNVQYSVGSNFNKSRQAEVLLDLAHKGYDEHHLDTKNFAQTVFITEFYTAHPWLGLSAHVLCYDRSVSAFPDEVAAAAWVTAHPGTEYFIGNEPDNSYTSTGMSMTEQEYADFYHYVSTFIRNLDATAIFYLAGYQYGSAYYTANNVWNAHTDNCENDMLSYYYSTYGEMDCQAVNLHSYQRTTYNNPKIISELTKFSEYTDAWLASGWIPTNNIIIGECGWNGNIDPPLGIGTAGDCMALMDWALPQFAANARVIRWHWWKWGAGSELEINGVPTELGLHYSKLAHT